MLASLATLTVGLLAGPIPEPMQAWRPALAFGEPAVASERLERWVELARAWSGPWALDAETRRRVGVASEHLDALDLSELHRMMPRTSTRSARRGWSFHGRFTPRGGLEVRTAPRPGPPRFGDGRVDLSLVPLPPDAFVLRTQVNVHAAVEDEEILDLARRTIAWLAEASRASPPTRPRAFDRGDAAMQDKLRAAFPKTSAFVLRYLRVEDIIEPSRDGARLRLVVRLDLDALQRDCPDLATTVARAAELFTGRGRLEEERGDALGVAQVRGPDLRARISLVLQPDRALRAEYRSRLDGRLDALGTRIEARGIRLRTQVERSNEGLRVNSRLRQTPRLTVETPALVDALIPSDLSTIVARFFEVMARGAGGRGGWMQVDLPKSHGEASRVEGEVALVDNELVTFGLRIVRALGWSEAHERQRRWLLDRALDAFAADLERFARATATR